MIWIEIYQLYDGVEKCFSLTLRNCFLLSVAKIDHSNTFPRSGGKFFFGTFVFSPPFMPHVFFFFFFLLLFIFSSGSSLSKLITGVSLRCWTKRRGDLVWHQPKIPPISNFNFHLKMLWISQTSHLHVTKLFEMVAFKHVGPPSPTTTPLPHPLPLG